MQETARPFEGQEPLQQGARPRRQQWEAESHQLQSLHAPSQSQDVEDAHRQVVHCADSQWCWMRFGLNVNIE